MNELIHEVEESLRQERLQAMWREYGPYIIGGAILAVLFTALSAGWRSHEYRINTAQTAAVIEAVTSPEPAAALGKITPTLRPGPRALAYLTEAGTLLQSDKNNEALAVYDRAAADKTVPEPFHSLAVLLEVRLAWSMKGKIDAQTLWPLKGRDRIEIAKTLLGQLQPLIANEKNPWHDYARIQAALITAHDLNDYSAARALLAPVKKESAGDSDLAKRASVLDQVYAAQGGTKPER
jgi:hypothetical protein